MKRKTDMFDFAFLFLVGDKFETVISAGIADGVGIDVVDQIIVEVIQSGFFQLFVKNLFLFFFAFQVTDREFAGDGKFISGVAFDQRFAEGDFALITHIHPGGVKISETAL